MGQVNGAHGSTNVRLAAGESGSWWARYEATLVGKIGATSLEVLGADAEFIAEQCVLAPDRGVAANWSASRERSGAVMGAVQSGKTASMLAVISKAIDGGVDAIVVLGGTRTSLWLQTWERLLAQLDTFPDRRSRRLMLPAQSPGDVVDGLVSLRTLYAMTDQLAARAIARKLPIIAVVLKQVDHLERMASTLHEVVYPQVQEADRPFHLLVVDDEADDSSIGENDLADSSSLQEKQVPRRIVDLWEARQQRGQTAIPQLRATYLAYTATPQANFLQDQSNPLAPRDFVVCLRTPGASGDPSNRDPAYRVPEGLPGWYTGGDVYYRTLATVPLCVALDDMAEDDKLLHGVRGFLVASALRLSRATSVGRPRIAGGVYPTAAEARDACGPVMSMLVHPSATKDAHFDTAGQLLAWSAGLPSSEGSRLLADGERRLRSNGVIEDMDSVPERWQEWLDDYEKSRALVSQLPGQPPEASGLEWTEVRRIVLEEVIPVTSVSVINSDERADDRPVFEPVRDGDGWRQAPNLSTIFVSGNVMSRGLTLEGLSTTLFTRASHDPASDTQMQMQRWFGYRGSYIDVCRVLMSKAQVTLFGQYHETDLALRSQILSAMNSGSPALPRVLQGRAFRATGRVRSLRSLDLWPGAGPFMTVLNEPEQDLTNQSVVAELFKKEQSTGVPDSDSGQGRLLELSLSLTETADFLEGFRYPGDEDIGQDPHAAGQWSSVERIARMTPGDHHYPIFRMPTNTNSVAWCRESPFNVASYLRFWALCLEERIPAAFTTDEPPLLWSLVDLETRSGEQPRFRIGLRFGAGPTVTDGPLSDLPWPVRPMKRRVDDNRLQGQWGSRNYRDGALWGDEFFDCYGSGQLPKLTQSRARGRGSDGLLLIHIVQNGDGVSLAPALSIPVGGPDQVHARSGGTSGA